MPRNRRSPGSGVSDHSPSADGAARSAVVKCASFLDESDDVVEALSDLQIAHDEGPRAAHALGVALHHSERGADIGREIDFVDDQQVRARDAGAAF